MEIPFIPFFSLRECDILDSAIMPQYLGENIASDKVGTDKTYSIIGDN